MTHIIFRFIKTSKKLLCFVRDYFIFLTWKSISLCWRWPIAPPSPARALSVSSVLRTVAWAQRYSLQVTMIVIMMITMITMSDGDPSPVQSRLL